MNLPQLEHHSKEMSMLCPGEYQATVYSLKPQVFSNFPAASPLSAEYYKTTTRDVRTGAKQR
jgi:hypothetical protein